MLTRYSAGYGIGPMLWSSMSEVPIIGENSLSQMTI